MNFLRKNGRLFLNTPIIYPRAKNQKKIMTENNCGTDGRTDNSDFKGPSIGWRSNTNFLKIVFETFSRRKSV